MTTQQALLKLMNLPTTVYQAVTKTSDGYYIVMRHGDIGYNDFLGTPQPPHPGPGHTSMLDTWNSLTPQQQTQVYSLANNPPEGSSINLNTEFGVPLPPTRDE